MPASTSSTGFTTSRTGLRRVLAQIDRRPQADRQRHDDRPGRHQQRAAEQRQDAELLRPEQRRPLRCRSETRRSKLRGRTAPPRPPARRTMPTVVRIETKAQRKQRGVDQPLDPTCRRVDRADGHPGLGRSIDSSRFACSSINSTPAHKMPDSNYAISACAAASASSSVCLLLASTSSGNGT